MAIVKKATSSFPLRLVSPENLLTYADQIAVETDANGNMTKSQAQLNAELAALAAGGGGGGSDCDCQPITLLLGSQANNISGLNLNNGKLSLNVGNGLSIETGSGKVELLVGAGLSFDEHGALIATGGGGGSILIQ